MATPGRRTDEHTRQHAVRLKANGVHVSEIARRLDMSRPTVRRILAESR